jgi:hypothetical protein
MIIIRSKDKNSNQNKKRKKRKIIIAIALILHNLNFQEIDQNRMKIKYYIQKSINKKIKK